jgi:stress response protein YsnF
VDEIEPAGTHGSGVRARRGNPGRCRADDAQFRERAIEATETSEEAVASKKVRVKEEVVVCTEAEERTQTVSDTVRRTEVKVEDERSRTDPKDRRDRV